MEFRRKATGRIELQLQGYLFTSGDNHAEVVIPGELLRGFRLSEIPDDLAIRPEIPVPGQETPQECNYTLFSFTEGVAWAQVEVAMKNSQLFCLAALSLAIAERQASAGDVEEDDFFEDERGCALHYLVMISQDLDIAHAIAVVERTATELERRRDEILGKHSSRLELSSVCIFKEEL